MGESGRSRLKAVLRRWWNRRRSRLVGPSGVYAVGLAGGRPVPGTVAKLPPQGDFAQSMIDPQGKRAAFWGSRADEPGYHLYVTDIEDRRCRQLTQGRSINGHPAWSSNGGSIIYFSSLGVSDDHTWRRERQFDTKRPPTNIFLLHLVSGHRRQVTFGSWVDERPTMSPTEDTVVFVSNRSGRLNLWSIDLGGQPERITDGLLDYRPQFSPDGELLAYFTADPTSGSHQLALVRWPGGERVPFAPQRNFRWVHGPFWSPSGDTLLVHALSEGDSLPSLWELDLATGSGRRITIEGVPDCSHGSWDRELTCLVFDTRNDLSLEDATLLS